ncbi:unnamed protein product, partial [Scytosiphon promiscuus]
ERYPSPLPNSLQASKLDKLAATGRFGLGFNAGNTRVHHTRCHICMSAESLVLHRCQTLS